MKLWSTKTAASIKGEGWGDIPYVLYTNIS
jgi:hypothetical protein